jgi:hypothetical protein
MKRILFVSYFVLNYFLLFSQNDVTWVGSVVDQDNQPIPNCSLSIQNYSLSTVSAQDGKFIFNLPKTIQAGSDLVIILDDIKFKVVGASIGGKNVVVNSKGEIETFLPVDLSSKSLKITVLNTIVKRIVITEPKLKEKNRWSDDIIQNWSPVGGGPDDLQYEIKGIVNRPPNICYIRLTVTIGTFGTWPQGEDNRVNEDGSWSATVTLKKSDGDKYKKIINLSLLDENKKQIDKYSITIE